MLAAGSKPLTDDEQLYLRLLEFGECMFLYYRRDMHLLSKDRLEESYTSTWSTNVKLIIHLVDNCAHAYTLHQVISSLMHL